MEHPSLKIIHDEHAALAAMLRSLSMLLSEHRRHGTLPEFDVLRAMLFYIDEFPGKLHHTKESDVLFPLVRKRSGAANDTMARLDHEHQQGERTIRDLEHALLAFEVMGEPRRAAFEKAVESYVDDHLAHMRTEEREVLPLAQQVLTNEDWAELDAEFQKNKDPLTGHEPADEYRALFSRIVRMAPAPIGLG
jgi:hemerythrin-like domain-containing protein